MGEYMDYKCDLYGISCILNGFNSGIIKKEI